MRSTKNLFLKPYTCICILVKIIANNILVLKKTSMKLIWLSTKAKYAIMWKPYVICRWILNSIWTNYWEIRTFTYIVPSTMHRWFYFAPACGQDNDQITNLTTSITIHTLSVSQGFPLNIQNKFTKIFFYILFLIITYIENTL